MTDIWRSLIAQRIATVNGWCILFHQSTVWQQRNEHNLMRDFSDEVPGYLHNRLIGEILQKLDLQVGRDAIGSNLMVCYEALVRSGIMDKRELPLLQAWTSSVADLQSRSTVAVPS